MIKRKLLHNRKAQVTAFMIIGIIILFSTALIFYIKGKVQIPEEELTPRLQEIPDVLKPVRQYVELCASQKMEEGLYRAMEHGGLIYTEGLTIDIADPTEGEGVEYYPGSDYKIPYWLYMKSKNDCTGRCEMATAMPPLCKPDRMGCAIVGEGSVEEQLERYLNEGMKECIGDFGELAKQGYKIKELSNLTTKVNIRQKDAVALIKYELDVEKDDTSSKIVDYYSATPSRMTEMYETALQMLNYTSSYCFYERFTLDQIATYSGINSKLPPMSAITFGENKRWMMYQVKDRLKDILTNMIQMVRYNNSGNFVDVPTRGATGEYRFTRVQAFERTVANALPRPMNIEVYTKYMPWWDIYLKIDPSEGGVVKPSNDLSSSDEDIIGEILKLLSYREYIYTYRTSYPIITEMIFADDKGEKHVFRYAQEVNMIGGNCVKPSTALLTSPATIAQTILCDEDMREPNNTTIKVYDDFNRTKPLGEVDVIFDAGEKCNLGTTDENGTLTVRMPQAYGYSIILKKEGYLRQVIHQDDIPSPIKSYLKPIVSKKISIKVINESVVEKIQNATTTIEALRAVRAGGQELNGSHDKLLIKVERIPDSYQDPEFKKVSTYENWQYRPAEIDLTTGTFEVNIQMMDKRNYTLVKELDRVCEEDEDAEGSCVKTPIDSDCSPRGDSYDDFKASDCYILGYTCESAEDARDKNSEADEDDYESCVWAWISGGIAGPECIDKVCAKDELVEINETNVTNIIAGGVILDNSSKYFKITDPELLMQSENITFYVFRQPIPVRHHEMEELTYYMDWSVAYANYVMPVLR